MVYKTLAELNKEKDEAGKPAVSSYTGGAQSGLAVDQPTEPSNNTMELYSDGFVMLGRFRPFSERANVTLWEQIKAGQPPDELKAIMHKYPEGLTVTIVDYSPVSYLGTKSTHSKRKPNPFEGQGHKTAEVVSRVIQVDPTRANVPLNSNIATITLKFRLANGTQMSQIFNVTHTLNDVYNLIDVVAPMSDGYKLLCGYPPKELLRTGDCLHSLGLEKELLTQRPKI